MLNVLFIFYDCNFHCYMHSIRFNFQVQNEISKFGKVGLQLLKNYDLIYFKRLEAAQIIASPFFSYFLFLFPEGKRVKRIDNKHRIH